MRNAMRKYSIFSRFSTAYGCFGVRFSLFVDTVAFRKFSFFFRTSESLHILLDKWTKQNLFSSAIFGFRVESFHRFPFVFVQMLQKILEIERFINNGTNDCASYICGDKISRCRHSIADFICTCKIYRKFASFLFFRFLLLLLCVNNFI